MTNHKILFGIICFREQYFETVTFQKLVSSYKEANLKDPLNIFIFDNTDLHNWEVPQKNEMDNINVNYEHHPSNPGISFGVNTFSRFAEDKYDWIVILDQDTDLPSNFVEKYFEFVHSNFYLDIAFPKVYSKQKLISPSFYNYYRTSEIQFLEKEKIELRNITAINSGLLIKNSFLRKFDGYNPELRIDFCDHEFFERINGKKIFAKVLDVILFQDFSSDTDDRIKSVVRYKLYKKDMINYRKGKNAFLFFLRVDLPHLIKLTLKYKTLDFLKIRLTDNY